MKSIGTSQILHALNVTGEQLEEWRLSGVRYIEYTIDGQVYRIQSTARNLLDDLQSLPMRKQKTLVKALGDDLARPGDETLIPGDGKKHKGRLIRVADEEPGVITLRLCP